MLPGKNTDSCLMYLILLEVLDTIAAVVRMKAEWLKRVNLTGGGYRF